LEHLRVYTAVGSQRGFANGPVELDDHPALRHVTLEQGGGGMLAFNNVAADRSRVPRLAAVDVLTPSAVGFPAGLVAIPAVVATLTIADVAFPGTREMQCFFGGATALRSLTLPQQRLSLSMMDNIGRCCFARLTALDVVVSSSISTVDEFADFLRAIPNVTNLRLGLPLDIVLGRFMEALRSPAVVAEIPRGLEVLTVALPRNTRSGQYVPRAPLLSLITGATPPSLLELHIKSSSLPDDGEQLHVPTVWPPGLRLFCDGRQLSRTSRAEVVRRGIVDLDVFYQG
jgi:hypothetical protein